MKKIFVFIFTLGCIATSFGQDNKSLAKKIANAAQDPSTKCTTEDGRSGTWRAVSRETVTSNTSGTSNTTDTGRDTYGGSLSTSGIGGNYSRTTGTESNTNNSQQKSETKIIEKCVPNRW